MFILWMKNENIFRLILYFVSHSFCSVSFSLVFDLLMNKVHLPFGLPSLCTCSNACHAILMIFYHLAAMIRFVNRYKNVYACNKCLTDSIQFASSFDWKLKILLKRNARRETKKKKKKSCLIFAVMVHLERLRKWAMFMFMIIHDKGRSLHILHIEWDCLMLIHFHIKHENS